MLRCRRRRPRPRMAPLVWPSPRGLDELRGEARCQPYTARLIGAIQRMHSTSPEEQVDLVGLIRDAGLRYESRGAALYGDEAHFMLPNTSITGRVDGARTFGHATHQGIYHQPGQLACALEWLVRDRAPHRRIRRMLEVGVDGVWSGTFMSAWFSHVARARGHDFEYSGILRPVSWRARRALVTPTFRRRFRGADV